MKKVVTLNIAASDDEIAIREKIAAILDPLPQASRERVIRRLRELIDKQEAVEIAARRDG